MLVGGELRKSNQSHSYILLIGHEKRTRLMIRASNRRTWRPRQIGALRRAGASRFTHEPHPADMTN